MIACVLLGHLGLQIRSANAQVFDVTNGNASGAGSLPQAVFDANASGAPSSIQIEVPTVNLSNSLLILNQTQFLTTVGSSQINLSASSGDPNLVMFGNSPTKFTVGNGVTLSYGQGSGIYLNTAGSTAIVNGTILTGGTADGIQTAASANIFVGQQGLVHSAGAAIRELGGIGGQVQIYIAPGGAVISDTQPAIIIQDGTYNIVVDGVLSGQGPTIAGNVGNSLSGSGTVSSLQLNGGDTFSPGSSASPGSFMTINGNLGLASGVLYAVYLNPTNATFAKVTGTATLGGTVQANFTAGSYVAKQYIILTASGGISGTFSQLINVGLPAGIVDRLSYDANDVYLNLALGNFSGLNQNQQAVSDALTKFFNTNGGIPAQFFGLSPAALTQISGEAATGTERAAFQLTNEFLSLMLDPFVSGRGNMGAMAVTSPASGFAPEQTSLPPDLALAYASILNKAPSQNFEQRWTAWGSAFGGANNANGDPSTGSNSVKTTVFGFAGGMDYHVAPQTVVGFALAGAGTNWGLTNALGGGRSDALQAGAYGISWFGRAYLAGALSFSNHWFNTGRSALGDQLNATFTGQSYGVRIESGYRVGLISTLGVTPYGAVQFQDFKTPAYSETDATNGGFGLSYAAMNATDVRTELGSRFDAPTVVYGKPIVLNGRLAWAHDFVSNPTLDATFQSLPGGSFTVNGAPIARDSALASAGAELFLTTRWTLLAKFDGEFANGSQTYAGSGTLRYWW
jgi:uncharacterized protein with beta-barrel porin domain